MRRGYILRDTYAAILYSPRSAVTPTFRSLSDSGSGKWNKYIVYAERLRSTRFFGYRYCRVPGVSILHTETRIAAISRILGWDHNLVSSETVAGCGR